MMLTDFKFGCKFDDLLNLVTNFDVANANGRFMQRGQTVNDQKIV